MGRATGEHNGRTGGYVHPMDVAAPGNDLLYVVSRGLGFRGARGIDGNCRIGKTTIDEDHIGDLARGQFTWPCGIDVDNDGDIYVADLGNNRIQMFNSEGIYVQSFVGDGTLSKSAIQYVMANAKALRLRYMSNTEPEKLLLGTMAVTVDDNGRMFVPDNGHSRVQVYQKEAIPLEEHQVTPPPRVPTLDTV